jgi:hypothetical protein
MNEFYDLFYEYLTLGLFYLDTLDEVSWLRFLSAGSAAISILLIIYIARKGSLAGHKPSIAIKTAGMGKSGMRATEKIMVEDILVHGIEEAVFNKKLSRRRARHIYTTIGEEMQMVGLLLPLRKFPKLHPERIKRLKDRIKQTLATSFYKLKVKFPSETPIKKELVQPITKTNSTTKLRIVRAG